MKLSDISASACALPNMGRDELCSLLSSIGFARWEAFVGWTASAFDPHEPLPNTAHQIKLSSLHLTEETAESGAVFASALGAKAVVLHAGTAEGLIQQAEELADKAEVLGLDLLIEPHRRSPVCDLASLEAVMKKCPQISVKPVLEVGHFSRAGITWQQAVEARGLDWGAVHLKDAPSGCPFGEGELQIAGLVDLLIQQKFSGLVVVEILEEDAEVAKQRLQEAYDFIQQRVEA